MRHIKLLTIATLLILGACGGGGSSDDTTTVENSVNTDDISAEDQALRALISDQGLSGNASTGRTLPSISDALPQLGKKLFFSKSLGGGFDAACVSCHHPSLGGADDLSLPIGVSATNDDLIGNGRVHSGGEPLVGRNSPTVFNVALNDSSMFWDSRVESLGKEAGQNGAASGISTPDSSFGVADNNAGNNLVAAQARFPVTDTNEMKTSGFENGSTNDTIRDHLAGRIGDYGAGLNELVVNGWLNEFQTAFSSTDNASTLVTFDNIVEAIGEYERSMVFIDNPWKAYVEGDNDALSDEQKAGAILFFTTTQNGGGGCAVCHSGDLFTDNRHHVIAFPQIGPGKGDGANDDFGRERVSGNAVDRYRFRTPSLLNVAMTAPYGHAGSYENLNDVLRHYNNPNGTVDNYFNNGGWCQLDQFENEASCNSLYPDAENNSDLALGKLQQERNSGTSLFGNININNNERQQIIAFLNALTDPCIQDRNCLAPWIPDTSDSGPDNQQLNAVDESLNFL